MKSEIFFKPIGCGKWIFIQYRLKTFRKEFGLSSAKTLNLLISKSCLQAFDE